MFRLNRNKQKTNRNNLIGIIFWNFFCKVRVFPFFPVFSVFFGLFRNSLFRLFRFYTETESFDVSIEPKQTKDQPKQFEREHIWVFFRKFRVVSVCYDQLCLFRLFWYKFETPIFHETNPNTSETDLVSVRTEIFFVCFEDTLDVGQVGAGKECNQDHIMNKGRCAPSYSDGGTVDQLWPLNNYV